MNSGVNMNDFYFKSITAAINKILVNHSFSLTPQTTIIEDLGFESIDFVDFVFMLERETKLSIDINHLSVELSKTHGRRFQDVTILDLINYLEKNFGKK